MLAELGRYDESVALEREAIELAEAHHRRGDMARVMALNNHAVSLYHAGRYDEALGRIEQALAEMDRVLRPGGEIVISSRLVDDGGIAAPFWKLVAPLARAIGWSSDFKVSRLTDWAAKTGRYETVHVGQGYFKVVRLKKLR